MTLLCLPQRQRNSKRYWKRAINLSLPLLLARNRLKKMLKLPVYTKNFLVISLVMREVLWAWRVRSEKDPIFLNGIYNVPTMSTMMQ